MSQYRPLYRRKAEVQQEEETIAIQYIVSQERNLQGIRKYIATQLGVSQDRLEAEIPAQKEMSCNTQDCIARLAREEILALRRTCIAIQKIVSQDSLLRRGGHAQRYIKSCCKTAVAQEGKRVYRKTNLSLAIQSHTKQLEAVSSNTVPRPTRRYNLEI